VNRQHQFLPNVDDVFGGASLFGAFHDDLHQSGISPASRRKCRRLGAMEC
jgi:hypothetical protein